MRSSIILSGSSELLDSQGYFVADTGLSSASFERVFREICNELGPTSVSRGPSLDYLRVRDGSATPSLTAHCGSGAFPFHTDTVTRAVRARYIALGCLDPGATSRPTRIADSSRFTKLDQRVLRRAVFAVQNGKSSFLTTIVSQAGWVRFDPICMKPLTREAKTLVPQILQSAEAVSTELDWTVGRIAIFDNWRLLHARAAGESTTRTLVRVYIDAA